MKEEENERLKREIDELKHRERVAAARQAPKPRLAPMTLTDEPTEKPDFPAQISRSKDIKER